MIVDLPQEYKNPSLLVDTLHEEDALCWLWAFPNIFPWPNKVAWLYTPVVGNKRWPGDLWRIDSAGNLLITEAKQCKRRDDPFIDFVRFHHPSREEFSAVHWQQKWSKHFSAEISLPNGWSERPPGKTDGILPRSNRRSHMRRWPSLSQLIDDQIRNKQYAQNVRQYLLIRDQIHNPIPYYIGLMIETDQNQQILTENAKRSAKTLITNLGYDHIKVIVINCKKISDKKGLIGTRLIGL